MNTVIAEKSGEDSTVVFDVFHKLANERVLFIDNYLDESLATDLVASIIMMDLQDPKAKITLNINSDGGSIRQIFMLYDVMQAVDCPIETVCLGSAAREMSLILAAGTKGMRKATRNAIISVGQLVHDSSIMSDLSDAKSLMERVKYDNKQFISYLAKCTGQKVPKLLKDLNYKKFMSSTEAKKYGVIDQVI